jgi:hypothetical protein
VVIDILSNGQLSFFFCYRPSRAGATVAAGGSSAASLKTGQWAHVALVCDRNTCRVETYINGFGQGSTALPPDFAGDFSLGGELTLGSGWHNYWGLIDEVKVYRRALPRAEVKAEFARLKGTFGVTESPEAATAEKREALMDAFAKTHVAWAAGDYASVRTACATVIASPDAPASLRSYADLRGAQSYTAEGKIDLAKAEYGRIAANTAYPLVHRAEASDCEAELDRAARGLPRRDPAASRTGVARVVFAAKIFVSPRGSDANDGSATAPVATLTRARDLVRALKAAGTTGAIAVAVQAGEYRVTGPLTLSQQDSGTTGNPVVYQAVPGDHRLRPARCPRLWPAALAANPGVVRQRPADDPGALAQQGFRRHPQAGAARIEGGRQALGLRVHRRPRCSLDEGRRRLAVGLLPLPLGRCHGQDYEG